MLIDVPPLTEVPIGSVLPIPFATYSVTNRASITMSGLAVTDVEIYKKGSTTQRASDSGYSLLDSDGIDFDAVTGIHALSVDTGDGTVSGFWEVGAFYFVVLSTVTVDSQAVNAILAYFRLVAAEEVPGVRPANAAYWAGDRLRLPRNPGTPEVHVTHWANGEVPIPRVPGVPLTDGSYVRGAELIENSTLITNWGSK